MINLNEFKSSETKTVQGTTVIHHNIRTKLKITCVQYVMMDFVQYCFDGKKDVNEDRCFRHTGIYWERASDLLKSLVLKELIEVHDKYRYKPTKKWYDAHKVEVEENFAKFWKPNHGRKWTGSFADAKIKFARACTKYSPEYIIAQKEAYFKYLSHPDNLYRKVMGASVFLNLQTKRFTEEWTVEQPKQVADTKRSNMTLEERKKLYE